jgi:hypothetical protein
VIVHPERRYVLVLGHPKRKKFLVADPHPGVPPMYRVPLDAFRVAWHAGATGKLKPWAGIVWMPRSMELTVPCVFNAFPGPRKLRATS